MSDCRIGARRYPPCCYPEKNGNLHSHMAIIAAITGEFNKSNSLTVHCNQEHANGQSHLKAIEENYKNPQMVRCLR